MNGSEYDILNVLDGRTLIIGREGHVYVSDPAVSKQHAEMRISQGKIRLRDLQSTNGTYIFKSDVPVPLHDEFVEPQHTIMIGEYKRKVQNLLDLVGSFTIPAD